MSILLRRRKFLSSCIGLPAIFSISAPSGYPAPKFQIGQEIQAPWENDEGVQHSRAVIIGMIHSPTGHKPSGWWYLPRWIDNPECPWMVGRDDGHFWPKARIKAV